MTRPERQDLTKGRQAGVKRNYEQADLTMFRYLRLV